MEDKYTHTHAHTKPSLCTGCVHAGRIRELVREGVYKIRVRKEGRGARIQISLSVRRHLLSSDQNEGYETGDRLRALCNEGVLKSGNNGTIQLVHHQHSNGFGL